MFKWLFGSKALLNELNTLSNQHLRTQKLEQKAEKRRRTERERLIAQEKRSIAKKVRATMTPATLADLNAVLKQCVANNPASKNWNFGSPVEKILRTNGCLEAEQLLSANDTLRIAVHAAFPIVKKHFKRQRLKVALNEERRVVGRVETSNGWGLEYMTDAYEDFPYIRIYW